MGEHSTSEVIDIRVKDNEKIKIENIELISMHTEPTDYIQFFNE